MAPTHTIFYDGVCGLCDRLTQLVIKQDHEDRFRFAALQGAYAQTALLEHGVRPLPDAPLDTMYVLTADGRLLDRAEAALFILQELDGLRDWARFGGLLPKRLRKLGYEVVAKSRYRVFGKAEACLVPSAALRHKFIEDSKP